MRDVLTIEEESLLETVRECAGHYVVRPGNAKAINDDIAGMLAIVDRLVARLATPSPETGTAAVPACLRCNGKGTVICNVRECGDPAWRQCTGLGRCVLPCPACPGSAAPAGPAPEPVKPPAHPLFPDPRTVCKPCDGTGRDTRVPANGWDVACSACNGTGRTPAAGTAPKGAR